MIRNLLLRPGVAVAIPLLRYLPRQSEEGSQDLIMGPSFVPEPREIARELSFQQVAEKFIDLMN